MSSLKKGVMLRFGLMQFSVSIHKATAVEEAEFNMICQGGPLNGGEHPPARVKQKTSCPVCANDQRSTFDRGKEVGGKIVVVNVDELNAQSVPEEVKKNLTLTVHPVEQVAHMLPTGNTYYLEAEGDAAIYSLLGTAIEERPDKAVFTEFAIRTKPRIYQLITLNGGVLALREFARPQAIKAAPEITGNVDQALLGQARMLLDVQTTDFNAEDYTDKRAAALAAYIATAEGLDPAAVASEAGSSSAPTMDMSAMLTASIEQAVAAKAPAKKAVAKKTAKKTVAKKTAKKAVA